MSDIQEEIWKDIIGFEGLYQVSNLGRVRGVERCINWRGSKKIIKGCIKAQIYDKRGYPKVGLSKDGKYEVLLVHRLVAKAFIPIPDELKQYIGTRNLQVNHKDEVKTNNCVYNLEWCTNEYNYHYGTRIERVREKNKISQKNHPKKSKRINQFSLDNKFIKTWPSIKECERNGYNRGNISTCLNGGYFDKRRKKFVNITQANGFIWKYAD